ncbi:MAG: DUF4911 domain-containing protein [Deltaproteobacteria bacterium]|nr:DUF4911 domain-containing protein [Deltaproteobacteria bacterium]MBW2619968.1 DUF4911 domain-containing protein [Deltaproteobacteria bacterium]MBW2643742.1 DUF4911 domain-containing protein [Deltaproteobacteria bacterium]
MKTKKKYFRVDRRQIGFLKFIFEAYDGIVTITTVDPDQGVVLFCIAPGCENDVEMILQDLKKDIMIERIDCRNYVGIAVS